MTRGLLFLLLAIAILPAIAIADGKIYPRGVAVSPPIPDQQAIIAWDAATSTQTLAIETRFGAVPAATVTPAADARGDSPYAWIVPLPGPAAPRISAATPGLFPTVRTIFRPRVYDSIPDMLAPLIFLTAMLLLGTWVSMRGGGSKLSSLVSVLLVLLGFTCIGGLLLPTLGTARSSAGGAAPGVNVLSREIVGSYDISVIGADAAAGVSPDIALAAWFKENGFQQPASALPVLADYAARSWVFAAVKLRPDAAANSAAYLTPHPLIFTFKAAAPVYPMRLTGIDNGPLTLDLYVFGQARASTPGLSEIRCDRCEFGERTGNYGGWRAAGVIGIGHPVLKDIVHTRPVATKLSGTLTPAMQLADMPITWSAFERSGEVMHSPHAARWLGVRVAFVVLPVAIVVLVIVGAVRGVDGRFVFRQLWWVGVIAVLAGIGAWMATPTVEVRPGGSTAAYRRERDFDELPDLIRASLPSRGGPVSIEDVRATARAIVKEHGIETREGDAAHEYTIDLGEQSGTIDFVARNWCGAPIPEQVWPAVAKRR